MAKTSKFRLNFDVHKLFIDDKVHRVGLTITSETNTIVRLSIPNDERISSFESIGI